MTNDETNADFAKRAATGVLGYAVAITLVHLGQGILLLLALGQPPLTGMAAWSIVMELLLGLLIGLIAAPLYKAPRGDWLFPLGAAFLMIVVERIVAVDPSKIQMWVGPSFASLIVFSIGRALYRWKAPSVVAVSLFMPVFLISLPIIAEALRDEPESKVQLGEAPADAPDVLMIVMDTVRSQSCSIYGYERDTTPTLARLAEEGMTFDDAYAPATWSLPAHAALFTGTFPSYNNANGETRFLDGTLPTLAEVMVASGWESYAFSANPHISDGFGLTRGFMHNDKAWAAGTSARNFSFIYRVVDALGLGTVDDKGGAQVIGNIEQWMAERPKDDGPAFVFVNFLEAHFPFAQLPKAYREAYQSADKNTLREVDQIAFGVQFGRQLTDDEMTFVHQPLIDLYDGGVKYTDFLVGEVVRIFEEAGRLDNTIVVVLADHGEVVGEHGAFGHVTPVLEQDQRVPLVIRYPKGVDAGVRVANGVSTVGTMDTIFELADIDPGPLGAHIQVASLLDAESNINAGKPLLAERFEEEMLASRFPPGAANGTGEQVNPRGRYRVFRDGPWKLVQHSEDGTFLFNLEDDPGEFSDLAGSRPSVVDRLVEDLDAIRDELRLPELDAEITPPEMPEMTKEECESLKKLGYLDDSTEC